MGLKSLACENEMTRLFCVLRRMQKGGEKPERKRESYSSQCGTLVMKGGVLCNRSLKYLCLPGPFGGY